MSQPVYYRLEIVRRSFELFWASGCKARSGISLSSVWKGRPSYTLRSRCVTLDKFPRISSRKKLDDVVVDSDGFSGEVDEKLRTFFTGSRLSSSKLQRWKFSDTPILHNEGFSTRLNAFRTYNLFSDESTGPPYAIYGPSCR